MTQNQPIVLKIQYKTVRIIIQWCFISTNVTICNTNSSWFYLEKWYFMTISMILSSSRCSLLTHIIILYRTIHTFIWIRGFGHALGFRWNVHGLRSEIWFWLDLWLDSYQFQIPSNLYSNRISLKKFKQKWRWHYIIRCDWFQHWALHRHIHKRFFLRSSMIPSFWKNIKFKNSGFKWYV